jgi:hypothetical protein
LRINKEGLSNATAQREWYSGLDAASALSVVVGGGGGGGGGGGDSHAMGSGQEAAHIYAGMERVALPERWPFAKTPECKNNVEDMVGWARTLAMTRIIDKTLSASAQKKACTVHLRL